MNAKQITNALNETPELKGLTIRTRTVRNEMQISVYGFNQTPDWKVAKAMLQEMGFGCGPNTGDIIVEIESEDENDAEPTIKEIYEASSEKEQYEMDAEFVKSGGHLSDEKRERHIIAGLSFETYKSIAK